VLQRRVDRAPVYQEILPNDVTSVRRCTGTRTLCRTRPGCRIGSRVSRPSESLHTSRSPDSLDGELAEPIGLASRRERPRQQVVDRDVVFGHLPCEASTKPVNPARAPLESPRCGNGAFTDRDVILTMRPKRRSIMPSRTARDQHDRRDHVVVDRLLPLRLVPVAEVSDGRPARVVDEDVRRGARGKQRRASLCRG
jgi:hypothetical protein